MSYTSFYFLIFLAVVTAAYFIVPLRARWLVLLAGSLCFYWMNGKAYLPFLLADALISYGAARLLAKWDRKTEKRPRVLVLSVTLVLLVAFLCFTKFAKYFAAGASVIVPLGISYYTFSTIGYLLDVYWGRCDAQKSFLQYLLFISFFPHIVQGPIARFNRLSPQLKEGHRFDYERVCFGAQLIVWGFFQKLVIADRLDTFVSAVYDNCREEYGLVLIAATFFYAIEIYTDFAGCVNIARGVSQIYGIELEENFRQPYFSRSVEEFWRRWHITLGSWFRDYLGMPVSVSAPVKRWSKAVRKKRGAKAGRQVSAVCMLAVVWLCTGLWHGTGWNYILWGVWQGGIIILSLLLKDRFAAWKERLHIREDSKAFGLFRMVRTFVLAGMIPRVITHAASLKDAWVIFGNTFRGTGLAQLQGGGLARYGWTRVNLLIALAAIVLQLAVSLCKERGIRLRERIAAQRLPVRWLIYLIAFFSVVIFGIYGPGYDPKAFVYAGF